MPDPARYFGPAEFARKTGVSIKALRVYERRGLLAPVRTSAGWRAYGPEQLERLHEILALKSIGIGLAGIAELLAGQPADLAAALATQSQALQARRAHAELALHRVESAQQKLAKGGRLSVADLITLIQETTMDAQPAYLSAYLQRLEERLTPDELDSTRHRRGWERSYAALTQELRELAGRGEAPLAPASVDFMRRWSQFLVLGAGGSEAVAGKASEAWRDTMADPEVARGAPYGPAEQAWLRSVTEAVTAQMRALYDRAAGLARDGADPASAPALALVLRMRCLSDAYAGHRSQARQGELRAAMLRERRGLGGAKLAEGTATFLAEASARIDALTGAGPPVA